MKKIFLLLMAMLLAMNIASAAGVTATASVAATAGGATTAGFAHWKPMRVALVPVIDRTKGWLPRDDANDLLAAIEDQLHVPLNNTMHWVEYVPYSDGEAALETLVAGERKPDYGAAMRAMAERLPADLTLALVVESYYERVYHGFEGDLYVEAVVDMTMHGYDNRTGESIRKSAHRYIDEDYGTMSNARALAMDALDEIMREVAVNRRVMSAMRRPNEPAANDLNDAGRKAAAK